MNTQHTHQVIFGRKVAGCPRCTELTAGAPVRQQAWRQTGRLMQAQRIAAIRAHDCRASKCGPVCTAFDY